MSESERELPKPTPETQHFWDGTRQGELRLQRCKKTGEVYFPPRHFCPSSGSTDIEIIKASGRGTLHLSLIHI